jgi:hypothetical protein
VLGCGIVKVVFGESSAAPQLPLFKLRVQWGAVPLL